jgi:hypothetical protein
MVSGLGVRLPSGFIAIQPLPHRGFITLLKDFSIEKNSRLSSKKNALFFILLSRKPEDHIAKLTLAAQRPVTTIYCYYYNKNQRRAAAPIKREKKAGRLVTFRLIRQT